MTAGERAFEPRVVGFLCEWCACAAADRAGVEGREYPPGVHFLRVRCTGRVDPALILRAFQRGADGVLILGCHPGDCHYQEQNLRALQRHRLVLRVLGAFGVAPERCRLAWVSSAEGARFAALITETLEQVRALGPR